MTFRPSNAKMPGWWQSLWRKRYVCGVQGWITVTFDSDCWYAVRPMGCGCGYRVYYMGDTRCGYHCPTLRGAMRQIKRHHRSVTS